MDKVLLREHYDENPNLHASLVEYFGGTGWDEIIVDDGTLHQDVAMRALYWDLQITPKELEVIDNQSYTDPKTNKAYEWRLCHWIFRGVGDLKVAYVATCGQEGGNCGYIVMRKEDRVAVLTKLYETWYDMYDEVNRTNGSQGEWDSSVGTTFNDELASKKTMNEHIQDAEAWFRWHSEQDYSKDVEHKPFPKGFALKNEE